MSAVQLLKKLFTEHFYTSSTGNLEWAYAEDADLNEIDPELVKEVKRIINLDKDEKPV